MNRIIFSVTLIISCLTLNGESLKAIDSPAKLKRSISGYTEPCAVINIEAEYPGRLENFYIDEGSTLTGDSDKISIASQDNKLASIQVEQAMANLKSQQQSLKKYSSEKVIAERELKYRQLEMNRIKALALKDKVTKASYDLAVFEHDRAKLKIKDINAAIAIQKENINVHSIKLKKAKEDLSRYTLYGPKGWILNERYAEPGSWVQPGKVICQLVDTRQLSLFFRLNEDEINTLRSKPVWLKGKINEQKIKAKIHRIDLTFDPNTRKRLVELRINSEQLPIATGGIEFELELEIPYPEPAVIIPYSYTTKKFDDFFVKLSSGVDLALRPLRQTSEGLIIDIASLPKDAEFIKPKKTK